MLREYRFVTARVKRQARKDIFSVDKPQSRNRMEWLRLNEILFECSILKLGSILVNPFWLYSGGFRNRLHLALRRSSGQNFQVWSDRSLKAGHRIRSPIFFDF